MISKRLRRVSLLLACVAVVFCAAIAMLLYTGFSAVRIEQRQGRTEQHLQELKRLVEESVAQQRLWQQRMDQEARVLEHRVQQLESK